MRAALFTLILAVAACDSPRPPPPDPLDCKIEENENVIACNQKRIEENERWLKTVQRVQSARRTIDCVNWELDNSRIDRDTVLAVTACLQKEGWRR